jgi:hypothetical protein
MSTPEKKVKDKVKKVSLSGGLAVLIDERGIDQLGLLLTAVNKFDEGTFINLLEMTDGDVGF